VLLRPAIFLSSDKLGQGKVHRPYAVLCLVFQPVEWKAYVQKMKLDGFHAQNRAPEEAGEGVNDASRKHHSDFTGLFGLLKFFRDGIRQMARPLLSRKVVINKKGTKKGKSGQARRQQ
jgi:hypothetical protein